MRLTYHLLFLSGFVYKFVISNLFVWMPCTPSLLYDSLSPGWKIDVPPYVRHKSVWGFVMLPWARILSFSGINLQTESKSLVRKGGFSGMMVNIGVMENQR